MKKIKIIKHVEIVYTPDEQLYGDMALEQVAEEDIRIVREYGESFLISTEGGIEENTTITWEIVEEDGKSD